MATAYMWGRRSVCKRNQVGCVITTQDMRRVLSIGYNGPAAALSHDECNEELTDRDGCGCLHAEMNAVAAVDSSISDKIVFVTVMPCRSCAQLLAQSNVSRVYYSRKYRNEYGIVLLRDAGVDVVRLAHEHVATLLRS